MDEIFIARLDYKNHRIMVFTLEEHDGFYRLISKFYKIEIEVSLRNLNSEGLSIDFLVIKNIIKGLSSELDGKLVLSNSNITIDQSDLLKVLCPNDEKFEFSSEITLKILQNKISLEKYIADNINEAILSCPEKEEIISTKITIQDIIANSSNEFTLNNQ